MANRKISDLTALTTTATGDLLPIVDISEAGAVDQNKKITVENLFKGIPGNVGIGTSSPSKALTVSQIAGDGDGISLIHPSRPGKWLISHSGVNSEGLRFAQDNGTSSATSYLTERSAHYWYTDATERMRIDSSGIVSITSSTTSTGGLLGINNSNNASGSGVMSLANRANNNNTSSYYLVCQEPSVANRCFIYGNGNLANANNSYGAISDVKLKENIADAASQWGDVKALQVRNYNFKEETGQQTHRQIGLVAQEAEQVSPGLVYESPDRDADGNALSTVTKNVNYSVLYMKAVKALQEAMERIETLEARLTAAGIA
jgi:hypothetical protein